MKKTLLLIILVGVLVSASTKAGVYYYEPTDYNYFNLPHEEHCTWGIDWTHNDEEITEVVLTFHNIWNWDNQPNNLYSHLLNDADLGVYYNQDTQDGDEFAGQGQLIGNWTDPIGMQANGFDLVYRFSSMGLIDWVTAYAADGRLGFAFDPDCHYYNSGVTLEITTAPAGVPEPTTMVLFGLGLAGAVVVRKFRG